MARTPTLGALPPRASAGASQCSVLRTISIVGDFWTLGILRCTLFGLSRFGEFERELGVATNVLTDRLAHLVQNGLLERTEYQTNPKRYEYTLTASGRELVPALLALKAWGDRHLQPAGPWTSLRHRGCASSLLVEARCPDCGDVLGIEDIETIRVREITSTDDQFPVEGRDPS